MTTSQIPATDAAPGIDADELARHIAEMYREVANEAVHDLHFHTGRGLAEALGYPADLLDQLPARAGSSFGVVNLSADKPAVFAEAARVLRPGGRLALADIVTHRAIATRTAAQPDLWAACIAGASQRDRYLQDIAAAGLELRTVRTNPAYRFASKRARRTGDKYGAHTIELLAGKPTEEISR
jgi:arsenite methyltransferase